MLILFLKSQPTESDDEMPLTEKLRRILVLKVETDKDRERAERELAKFNSPSSNNDQLAFVCSAMSM
jgi:hypothetical protein